jgi:hypothetical protein
VNKNKNGVSKNRIDNLVSKKSEGAIVIENKITGKESVGNSMLKRRH